ncbi:MAG TPA: hypothetical protein VKB00_08210, partial [Candidatus Limnocylindrales bacterium]|nr:hypothetical protein [Candidatus Limnocylindrales bacterium]
MSVVHITSTGRLPLPTKFRMISIQWQPRSMIAPARSDEHGDGDAEDAVQRGGERVAESRNQLSGDEQPRHVAIDHEHPYAHDAAAVLLVRRAQQNRVHRHLAQALHDAGEEEKPDS